MNRHFATCIVALSLVVAAAAQEPTVKSTPAYVFVPISTDTKDAPGASAFGGPAIQFDAKGVDFNPWLRKFVSSVRRNWFVPVNSQNLQGHVGVTFVVHRNGTITNVVTSTPSDVETFNRSAFNAIVASSPVEGLPTQYPDDAVTFTVTFFYNETPTPSRSAQADPPVQ